MQSTRLLKRRIKSVSNISQITKAMEMVSASKMKQAQSQALASRIYSRKLDEILRKISSKINPNLHPLLASHTQTGKNAILILSTDKGLTGSLNTNLFKSILNFQQTNQTDIYTLGKQAREFSVKARFNLVADFGKVPDKISYDIIGPIASMLMDHFLTGQYDSVYLAYMDFISTLTQKPRIIKLLPIQKQFDEPEETTSIESKEYLFEPTPQAILDWLLPYFVELTIYQSLLEALASEHSARMVAMKNASENANEIVSNLQLIFNRSRQASITSELLDITTASLTLA